jgi:hypothetical protein
MTRVLTAFFEDYKTAASVVRQLEDAGFSYREVSVISNDKAHAHIVPIGTTDDAVSGAGTGTAIGAVVGGSAGLLAGLGVLAIPGFGPLVAVGWLAAMAGGAAAGAAAGGMTGLLIGAGFSDEDAKIYSAGLQKGGTLVVLRVESGQFELANSILAAGNPRDLGGITHIDGSSDPAKVDPVAGRAAGRARPDDAVSERSDTSVIQADRVKGTSVYDPGGKHLGVVSRLMIHKASGQVAYVVMSSGAIHGMGGQDCFIPWRALTYDAHLQGYRTTITEEMISTAPTFSRDPDWKWTDPGRERELHAHYGVDYMGH